MSDLSTVQFAFIAAAFAALIFMVTAFYQWRTGHRARLRAHQLEIEAARSHSLQAQIETLKAELKEAVEARVAAEKKVSVAVERVDNMHKRMSEWEQAQEQMKLAAKASVMEAGQKLSSKLLEDHKRENDEAKKEAEKRVKAFQDQFEAITKSVGAIQAQTTSNAAQVETVMRALTNPGGAGHLAEVGLENSLKNLGLEAGRDFIMQYHIAEEGGNLRPDAVIFLPQDMVMVIDAKASKFWMDWVEAEGSDHEEAVLQQFVSAMHKHIATLAQKQYADSVEAALKKQGRRLGTKYNVMYLPSDAAVDRLRKADASLLDKCEKAGVIIAGPASLAGLFSLAKQQISAAKRDDNQQQIIEQLKLLMANMVMALSHVDGMGKNIQQSARKFAEFAKSMNRNVLPKLRQMESLGVSPAKNKSIPHAMGYYDVVDHSDVVSLEADETEEFLSLEDKKSA